MQQEAWTRVSVRRTHLELRCAQELRPGRVPSAPLALVRRRPITPADYRELYTLVGELWLWRDRLVWSEAELQRYLDSPDVHIWTAELDGAIAGYFELRQHADG